VSAEDLLDRFEVAWTGRDPAAFAPLTTPDVHYEDPLLPEPIEGPDALAAHAARMWAAFPDARVERTGPVMAGGRHVSDPVKLVATHRGELEGLPPTSRFVVVHAVLVCELDEPGERLFRIRAFFDAYQSGVQLGILPERGSLGGKALLMLRGFGVRSRG
jgi:predicted ester cyclase